VLVLEAARAVGFGPERPLPLYAHLPLLHGPDGKKLSKRHGAASVQELRDGGYLPAAVRNYLALLGWGAGDDATVLSTAELIERFTLQRVSRNPARFDEVKLKWLNGLYIRALPVEQLVEQVAGFLDGTPHAGFRDDERFSRAVEISQEKIHTLADFWPLVGFVLDGPQDDPAAREKWLDEEGQAVLADVRGALAEVSEFEEAGVRDALEGVLERRGCKPREVYQPLRVAISGTTISPGIFESVALLGKDETLRRIDRVL
jgi:glutamyl-tRNA synthetase